MLPWRRLGSLGCLSDTLTGNSTNPEEKGLTGEVRSGRICTPARLTPNLHERACVCVVPMELHSIW